MPRINFHGVRSLGQNQVYFEVEGVEWPKMQPLKKYLTEVNHSPTGFEWGYGGSGPAQLAYAILRTYFEVGQEDSIQEAVEKTRQYYMKFKFDVVAHLGRERWTITAKELESWLCGLQSGK